ncbi:MAG: hypothetical protein AB7E80_13545 [Hyphomicrobiaceae bacterium]
MDYGLLFKAVIVVILTLTIVTNLYEARKPSTPFSAYMWGKQKLLMIIGLGFLTILDVMSVIEIAVGLGYLSSDALDRSMPYFGVPMLVMSLLVIGLGIRAGLAWKRSRSQTPTS